jgi:hypothetical protein
MDSAPTLVLVDGDDIAGYLSSPASSTPSSWFSAKGEKDNGLRMS